MPASILDKHEFQDGRIVVYRRGDIADNSNYSVRLRIPKVPGYVIRSATTSDLFQARKFAEALYDELRIKALGGQSVKGMPFSKALDEFGNTFTEEDKKKRPIKDQLAILERQSEFLGKTILPDIKTATIGDLISFRRSKARNGKYSNSTAKRDLTCLKGFLNWCIERGHIASLPRFPKLNSEQNRRPHFDSKDWAKLIRHLREYVKHDNSIVRRDRIMLVNYVLLLGNTGIRVGEARNLKWRDISEISQPKGSNDPPKIALHVKGKTGAREVVSRTPDVKQYLARILELRRKELDGKAPPLDSLVFCHKDGKPIHSFKKSFGALLKSAKVEVDTHGQRRTIYSLRHTYATFRLMEGVHQFVLARNMGTSVAMLESFYGHTSNIAAAKELTKNSGYNSSAKTRSLKWIEE